MSETKNSLTDWPDNLKDVIDWFLRVGEMDQGGSGDSNSGKLKDAVKALDGFTEATKGLGEFHIEGLFKKVAEGFQQLIGYDSGQRGMTENGIGCKDQYTSSYYTQAKWESSLNTATSSEAQKAAHIFLCSMPLLYFGISYLFWMCCKGWKLKTIAGDNNGSDLYSFMSAMGYDTKKLNSGLNGQRIDKLLGQEHNAIDDFKEVSASPSYPDFLKKLQENGKQHLPNSAANAPLYVLYAASHAYLQYKAGPSAIMEIPQTQSDIAKTFNGYGEAVKKLDASNKQKLSDAYNTLLTQIQSQFNQDPPPPPSSSAGAAAGGVLGTAALGTTAALATNVGGITTTLKSFIPIFK
ncbi:variant erythrocyte surface antigen-1 family protein [Babesia caballi]|uniref:Variant erythrocyte surface antigen-1 family protein n=1 Tax=Babesia caballi TaxID=5871 RepID=A0AAV4M3M1_BABCB|nr:variant erythrocyte surface antigen-1 family protein [Babesia caballi]